MKLIKKELSSYQSSTTDEGRSALHRKPPSKNSPRRAHQLEAIRRIGELTFRVESADEIIEETLSLTLDVFAAKAASYQVYEAQADALVFRKVAAPRDAPLIGRAVSIQQGVNGKVFRTGIPELNPDIHDCPEWNSLFDNATGYHTESMLTAPVKRPDNSSLGIVQVLNGKDAFDIEDLQTLEIFCLYISQAIENERLNQQNREQGGRLQSLREFETVIESSLDPNKTLENVTVQLGDALGADGVRLWLYHPKTNSLQSAFSRGLRSEAAFLNVIAVGDGFAGRLAAEVLASLPQASNAAVSIEDLTCETKELMTVGPLRAEGFISYHAVPLVANGELKGIIDIYDRTRRPLNGSWLEFLKLLANMSASVLSKSSLISSLQASNLQLTSTFDDTLGGLAALLDLRAREPKGHVERVTQSMLRLARELEVPEESLVHMWRGAMLHDLGKIAVPDSILLKAGPLNEEEWLVMKNHPIHILELLWPIEYLRPALDIPCYHHERWDGSGYPHGLSGEQIPLGARIFAVIEAWDIMRCDRPFRTGWHEDKVRAYIMKQSGSAYDPRVVEAFQRLEL